MKKNGFALLLATAALCSSFHGALAAESGASRHGKAARPADAKLIQRGRYLATIAGCNDCHTPGYLQAGGKVSEQKWLTGDTLGWRGPWGTTYAVNLRTYMTGLSEQQWVKVATTMQPRPPMPWFNLRAMTELDLRALYRFVRYLGPAGDAAPVALSPSKEPPPPYVQFPAPPK